MILKLIVDTAHFRGNFPQKVKVQGMYWTGDGEPSSNSDVWADLIEPSKCEPHKEHEFPSLIQDRVFTHVKLIIIPDGGVKRIRVFGKREVQ
jgi:allantoicase